MIKSKLSIILSALLAFGVAFSGLWIMQYRLEKEKELLLSGKGKVMAGPFLADEEEEREAVFSKKLTVSELRMVLESLEHGEKEPHEPAKGQITMEEAIEIVEKWVKEFSENYLKLEGLSLQEYEKISSNLCVNKSEGKVEHTQRMLYSYWTVTLEGKEIKAVVVLNAVTGQILKASLFSYLPEIDFSKADTEQLMDDYIDSFGLTQDEESQITNKMVYRSLEGNQFYVMVEKANVLVSIKNDYDDSYEFVSDIHIFLSTEPVNMEK